MYYGGVFKCGIPASREGRARQGNKCRGVGKKKVIKTGHGDEREMK